MAGIAALAIGYVLSQFYRSFMAVLTPVLTGELGMTKVELSAASGAWFIAFASMQFAVGVSLDRFGPRRTASALLAVGGGAGAFLFSIATAPWMVIAAMALIGIGCAPVLMSALFIYARSYSPARFAVLASWTVAFGTAGNVIGASPLANAAEALGWRQDDDRARTVHGINGACDLSLRARSGDRKAWRRARPAFPVSANCSGCARCGQSFRSRRSIMRRRPGIRGLWAGPYLADVYGADALVIGQVTLFMALAMVAGAFIYGPLDTIFKTRKWVAVGGNSLSLLALTYLALNPVPGLTGVTILFVIIGLCGGSYGLLMAHARAFVPAHLTGRGVTLMNFFSIGGVGAMQFLTGGVVTASSVPGDPQPAMPRYFLSMC